MEQRPTASELAASAARLCDSHVIVVGDLIVDVWQDGNIFRSSPEAPVPIVDIFETHFSAGGAGNVWRNLKTLGCEAYLIAPGDETEYGKEFLRSIWDDEPADCVTSEDHLLPVKTRVRVDGQHLLRMDEANQWPIEPETEKRIVGRFKAHMADLDEEKNKCLILSDYDKGVVSDNLAAELISQAGLWNCPVVVDSKRPNFECFRKARLITSGYHELMRAAENAGQKFHLFDDPDEVLNRLDIDCMLVTEGKFGMQLFVSGRQPPKALDISADHEKEMIVDVCGAGDIVTAVMGAIIATGVQIEHGVELANIAAGCCVRERGTHVVTIPEIIDRIYAREFEAAEDKIITAESLENWLIYGAPTTGKRRLLGFVNGCFDLLHHGHVNLISKAKAECDLLVVGVNSDASVRALKGVGHPIQSEAMRALALAALEDVDNVVIFGDETPIPLLRAIKPDVLICAPEQQGDEKMAVLDEIGCKAVFIDRVEGISTSEVIKTLAGG